MRCMECGKEMQFTTAPMSESYRGEQITVKGIEHYICECGNDEMTAAEATKLRNMPRHMNFFLPPILKICALISV